MDAVSLEAYRTIVRGVSRRSDIAALCGVCRAFRRAAEPALYNTLTINDADTRVGATLVGSARIAAHVVALTVQVRRRHQLGEGASTTTSGSSEDESGGSSTSVRSGASTHGSGDEHDPDPHPDVEPSQTDNYWTIVAGALRNTTRLRHLTVDIADPADSGNAWVLDGCVFQLRTFQCDFDWDDALCGFLGTQMSLNDLALRDFRECTLESPAPATSTDKHDASASTHTPHTLDPHDTIDPDTPIRPATLDTTAGEPQTQLLPPPALPALTLPTLPPPGLPALAILECTFSAAAVALVPGRPLARLKTCFSAPDAAGKRAELSALLGALRLSALPIRALDIADAAYTEAGALELLHRIAHTRTTASGLRYLGTLVLPIGGRKRLHFYALLMRFRFLRCIEVDVSAWTPPPTSSPALRALAAELRLYCRAVHTIVFVGLDFERTVVSAGTTGVLRIDDDARPELFWREI
ncbi:hypothetical protein C8R43DRAFT_910805 [Mycena crocata]|nr:hypothetical protein C8R43DRAFT_910805 [Mycena crocata]